MNVTFEFLYQGQRVLVDRVITWVDGEPHAEWAADNPHDTNSNWSLRDD